MSDEQWLEPENALPGTEFEMYLQGVGKLGATKSRLEISVNLNGVAASSWRLGAVALGEGMALFFTIRLTVLILTAGTSGTMAVHWDSVLDKDEGTGNRQQNIGDRISLVQHDQPVGINTTVRNLVTVAGQWDATRDAAMNLTTRTTRLTRRGPA